LHKNRHDHEDLHDHEHHEDSHHPHDQDQCLDHEHRKDQELRPDLNATTPIQKLTTKSIRHEALPNASQPHNQTLAIAVSTQITKPSSMANSRKTR
jgi:hypothetical protein